MDRVAQDSTLCDGQELEEFLERHRAYARVTGDSEFLVKTFNHLASQVIRTDRCRADWAIARLEEALDWEPYNPHNWTAYAQALWAANRRADALDALWQARQRFAWNPFIRTELARLLREQGDPDTAVAVFREAAAHFPTNVVCRSGLAETLRALGENAEARAVYEQACRDFPTNVVCRSGLADLLIDLGDLDTAEKYFNEARDIESGNAYARGGLAEVWFIRGARANDATLRDRAKEFLDELASEGNWYASCRLRNFDARWELAVARGGLRFERETDALPQRPVHRAGPPMVEAMSPAERLGRAMIALWHAERASTERAELCTRAEGLLELPEAEMDELLPGFVETRGLVLLARGEAQRALDYFTYQIERQGRGGWLGIRLGEQRARLLLGEPAESLPDELPFDSRHARFALRVVTVIRILGGAHPGPEAAELLRQLYPEAARLADQWVTAATEEASATGDEATLAAGMIAVTLRERWFRPAQITSPDDFADATRLDCVLEDIRRTTVEVFDVLSNTALALAA